MGKALLVVIVVVLVVYSLFDVIATPRQSVRVLPKPLWLAVVLVPVIGAALWLGLGKTRTKPLDPPRRSGPTSRGPDDDPDFLRRL